LIFKVGEIAYLFLTGTPFFGNDFKKNNYGFMLYKM